MGVNKDEKDAWLEHPMFDVDVVGTIIFREDI